MSKFLEVKSLLIRNGLESVDQKWAGPSTPMGLNLRDPTRVLR